jgi:hypothetical protein
MVLVNPATVVQWHRQGLGSASTASCPSSASKISQATVAKYMVRRRGMSFQSWRCFLRNHAQGIAAIDMFAA